MERGQRRDVEVGEMKNVSHFQCVRSNLFRRELKQREQIKRKL